MKRMKFILPHLICPEQEVFIEGQSITDNVMFTHEFMHDLWHAQVIAIL